MNTIDYFPCYLRRRCFVFNFVCFDTQRCIYFSYGLSPMSFPTQVTIFSVIFDINTFLDKLNISPGVPVYVLFCLHKLLWRSDTHIEVIHNIEIMTQ